MHDDTTDTSVLISLQELARLEHERLREEERERSRARAAAEQARRLAEQEQHAAEEARQVAEQATRQTRRRAAAEDAARLEALKEAELVRARIEAEAVIDRELSDAQRRHETELKRLDQARRSSRLRSGLLATLVATLLAGGAAAIAVTTDLGRQESAQRASDQQLKARQQRYLSDRLAALDRGHAGLKRQLDGLEDVPPEVAQARQRVAGLRAHIVPGSLEEPQLDALDKAQEALGEALTRNHRSNQLRSLDELHAELREAAAKVGRRGAALKRADAHAATLRARLDTSALEPTTLDAFASSLEQLAGELGDAAPALRPGTSTSQVASPPTDDGPCVNDYDPLCGRLPGE